MQKHEATLRFTPRTVNVQIFNFLNFFITVIPLLREESYVVL